MADEMGQGGNLTSLPPRSIGSRHGRPALTGSARTPGYQAGTGSPLAVTVPALRMSDRSAHSQTGR